MHIMLFSGQQMLISPFCFIHSPYVAYTVI